MEISFIGVLACLFALYAASYALYVLHRVMRLSDDWCCPNLDNDFVIKVLLGLFVVNIAQGFFSLKWAMTDILIGSNLDAQAFSFLNLAFSFISCIFSRFIRSILDVRSCHNSSILATKYKVLELMANSVGTMIWAKSREGRLLFTNKIACDAMFFGDPRDIVNKTTDEISELARKRLERYTFGDLLKVIEGEVIRSRVPLRFLMIGCAAARGLWVAIDVTPSFDVHGNYIGYVGMGRDISHKCDDVAECIQVMMDIGHARPIRDDLYRVNSEPLESDCEAAIDAFKSRICTIGG